MWKVVAIMSMSLDGYVADPDDGVAEVFGWYFTSGELCLNETFTREAPTTCPQVAAPRSRRPTKRSR